MNRIFKNTSSDEENDDNANIAPHLMHPGLSNRYETIGNPGFQARSGISPAHNVDEEMKTFEEGKVIISL